MSFNPVVVCALGNQGFEIPGGPALSPAGTFSLPVVRDFCSVVGGRDNPKSTPAASRELVGGEDSQGRLPRLTEVLLPPPFSE